MVKKKSTRKIYTQELWDKLQNKMCLFMDIVRKIDINLGEGLVTTDEKNDKDKYHLIPLNNEEFINDLERIKKVYKGGRQLTFLDAGCGIGVKVMIARYLGFKAKGIELNDKYLKIARLLLPPDSYCSPIRGSDITKADILKYKRYNKFDIIYYYSPLIKLEKEFEEKVEDEAKVGAYIIAHNKRSSRIDKDKRFKKITRDYYCPIWKKIKK